MDTGGEERSKVVACLCCCNTKNKATRIQLKIPIRQNKASFKGVPPFYFDLVEQQLSNIDMPLRGRTCFFNIPNCSGIRHLEIVALT